MSRAVAICAPGGPEVLAVIDRRVRAPAAGEIRISVKAAAVNPTDIGLRDRGDELLPPPWIPGMDAAGIVESVGEGVTRLRPGEPVMAVANPRRPEGGAQQEQLVVPEASAVPIPESVTLTQAATLPMNGLTAMLGLDVLGLQARQTLAVSGGAGLLASYVIPLARRRGLRVIADADPDDNPLVRGFGADEIVPRGSAFSDAVRQAAPPDGADALYDAALLGRDGFGAIRDGGSMVVVRGWDGSEPERGIRIHPIRVMSVLQRTDWLQELREAASAGLLALRVAAEFAPEQAAEAQRLMDAGGLRGRALIVF